MFSKQLKTLAGALAVASLLLANPASLNAFTQVNVSVTAGNSSKSGTTGPFLYCHAIPVGTANNPPVPFVWYFGWTTFPNWTSIQSTTSKGNVTLGAPGNAIVKMFVTYRIVSTGASGAGFDIFTCKGLSYNGNGIAAQGTVQVNLFNFAGQRLAGSPVMPVTSGGISAQ
jgi:hypothetical protein